MSDDPITPDARNAILRDLARARAAFQQRAIMAHLCDGAPKPDDQEPIKKPHVVGPVGDGHNMQCAAILTERPFGEPAKQPATPATATGGYGDATKARDKT